MAIARFLDCMCLALRASGLWLRCATLQNLIPSFPWIAPPTLHPVAIQGKEGIKFCHLATLIVGLVRCIVLVKNVRRAEQELERAHLAKGLARERARSFKGLSTGRHIQDWEIYSMNTEDVWEDFEFNVNCDSGS